MSSTRKRRSKGPIRRPARPSTARPGGWPAAWPSPIRSSSSRNCLFVKRFTQETYPDVCLNHMPWVSRPGGDLCVLTMAGAGCRGPGPQPAGRRPRSGPRPRDRPVVGRRPRGLRLREGEEQPAAAGLARPPHQLRAAPQRGADPPLRDRHRRPRPAAAHPRRVERPRPDLPAQRRHGLRLRAVRLLAPVQRIRQGRDLDESLRHAARRQRTSAA